MSDSVWPHRRQPTRLSRPWDSPCKNTGVGCHFLLQCMKVKSEREVAQSCPTLSDPMDRSLPGSTIHEIFQARVLGWGAIVFSVNCLITLKWSYSNLTFHYIGLPCPSLSSGVCSNVRPLRWWCYLIILSSAAPFSSCPQFFPASGSLPASQLFASGGQSTKSFTPGESNGNPPQYSCLENLMDGGAW